MRLDHRSVVTFSLLASICMYSGISGKTTALPPAQDNKAVADFSGLAWVEGDTFLAAHDAKYPDEKDRSRASLIYLPRSLDGIRIRPLSIDWPARQEPPSDLESMARIPGTNYFLLTESGEPRDDRKHFRRIFLTEHKDGQMIFRSFTQLPATVRNIEGSAVWKSKDRYIFLFAERGDGLAGTDLFWGDLELQPLGLGTIKKTIYRPAGFTGKYKRPVSAIEIDSLGRIYIASAYDTEDDNGPFSSVIWRAGRMKVGSDGEARPLFSTRPQRLATLDGLKVESLAVRETRAGSVELFAGTDDENYGGVVRSIPLNP